MPLPCASPRPVPPPRLVPPPLPALVLAGCRSSQFSFESAPSCPPLLPAPQKEFVNIRKTAREILQKEDDLNEIVQLVGKVRRRAQGGGGMGGPCPCDRLPACATHAPLWGGTQSPSPRLPPPLPIHHSPLPGCACRGGQGDAGGGAPHQGRLPAAEQLHQVGLGLCVFGGICACVLGGVYVCWGEGVALPCRSLPASLL